MQTEFDVVFFQPAVGPLVSTRRGPSGGAEVQILAVARGLAANGWRVGLIVQGRRGELRDEVDGVTILPIWEADADHGVTRSAAIRRLVRLWRTTMRLMRTKAQVFVQMNAGAATGCVAALAKL